MSTSKAKPKSARIDKMLSGITVPGYAPRTGSDEVSPRRADDPEVIMVPPERVLNSRYQHQEQIDSREFQGLVESIKTEGFLTALFVNVHPERDGYYFLTAGGHQRRDAAIQAGIKKIPIFVEPPVPPLRQAIRAAKENMVRVNDSSVNQGHLFIQILKEFDGTTQEDLAAELGKDRSWVALRVMAARSAPDVQAMLGKRPDGIRVMTYLNRLESEADRADIITKYISGEYTTRMVAARVEEIQQARDGTIPSPPPAEPAADILSASTVQSEDEAHRTPDAADASPGNIITSEGAKPLAQVSSSARSPVLGEVSGPGSSRSSKDQREDLPQSAARQDSTRLALIVKLKESLDILQSYRRARSNAALTETEQEYLQMIAAIVQDLLP